MRGRKIQFQLIEIFDIYNFIFLFGKIKLLLIVIIIIIVLSHEMETS